MEEISTVAQAKSFMKYFSSNNTLSSDGLLYCIASSS